MPTCMFGLMLLRVLAAATMCASAGPTADMLSSVQLAQLLPLPGVLLLRGCSSTATAARSAFAAMSACGSCTLPLMMNTSHRLQGSRGKRQQKQQQQQ